MQFFVLFLGFVLIFTIFIRFSLNLFFILYYQFIKLFKFLINFIKFFIPLFLIFRDSPNRRKYWKDLRPRVNLFFFILFVILFARFFLLFPPPFFRLCFSSFYHILFLSRPGERLALGVLIR